MTHFISLICIKGVYFFLITIKTSLTLYIYLYIIVVYLLTIELKILYALHLKSTRIILYPHQCSGVRVKMKIIIAKYQDIESRGPQKITGRTAQICKYINTIYVVYITYIYNDATIVGFIIKTFSFLACIQTSLYYTSWHTNIYTEWFTKHGNPPFFFYLITNLFKFLMTYKDHVFIFFNFFTFIILYFQMRTTNLFFLL